MADGRLVVVVGGMNMDLQGRSFGAFRSGDSNPGEASRVPGGVGRNIAENLARLGAAVELVTVLGDDPFSTELETSCAEFGIGLAGALRLSSTPVSQYICLLGPEGELVGAVAAMEAFERLDPKCLAERAALLDEAALVVVDTNIPEQSITWIAARYGRPAGGSARGSACGGPFLVLDPVSAAKAARARASIGAFDLAKPNYEEARVLSPGAARPAADPVIAESSRLADDPRGRDISSQVELARLAGALLATGLGEACISLGREGLYFEGSLPDGSRRRGIVRPPASLPPTLGPVNVSGAGDAATAALAWGLLEGMSLEARARCALAASLLTAASSATVNPNISPALLADIAKGVSLEQLP